MNRLVLESLKEKLTVIPGINGREEYFNSAVLVLLILVEEEYHFVFQKRSNNIRQPGEICFPGGKFNPKTDIDMREAAIRETSEELGVDRKKISVIGTLDTIISPTSITIDAFLGIVDVSSMTDFQISSEEVDRAFTVPVSYFMSTEPEAYQVRLIAHPSCINAAGEKEIYFPTKELGLPERYWRPWDYAMYNVFVYRVAGETIWGITARLIRDVVTRIKGL